MWDDSVIPRMCQLTSALQVPQHLGLPAPVPPLEGAVVTALDPPLAATSVLRVTRGGWCESLGDALAGKATSCQPRTASTSFKKEARQAWHCQGLLPKVSSSRELSERWQASQASRRSSLQKGLHKARMQPEHGKDG